MSNEEKSTNQPSQPGAIETYKFGSPNRDQNDLLPTLAQALQAQIQVGNTTAIDKIIELQAQAITQEQSFRQQELDLAKKKLDQSHELALKRETRLSEEAKSTRNTTKWIIGAITFAFAGSLGIAVVNKDSSLADKVFTGAMSALGGGGLIALNQKKDKESQPKDSE
jgi:hypothetical protein